MRFGMRNALRAETLLFAAVVAVALPQSADHNPLHRVADVPLPGAPVRFDYQSGDLKAKGPPKIVVAKLAATSGGHSTRDVEFSFDGRRMLVSVAPRYETLSR